MANYYLEAGHCLKKMDIKQALPTYEKCIDLWANDGKISQSAKLLKEIAEGLEASQIAQNDAATVERYYERACDMYEMDEYGKSGLSTCR